MKISKQNQVLKDLLEGKEITPKDAWVKYGYYRLSDGIFKLRNKGFKIKTDTSKGFATYSMR